MPNDPLKLPCGLLISGKISISSQQNTFELTFSEGAITLNANSLRALLKLKSESRYLLTQAKNLSLPESLKTQGENSLIPGGAITVAVKGRPLGKILPLDSGVRFRLTPLLFLKKNP